MEFPAENSCDMPRACLELTKIQGFSTIARLYAAEPGLLIIPRVND
jgi:hypothetical protein